MDGRNGRSIPYLGAVGEHGQDFFLFSSTYAPRPDDAWNIPKFPTGPAAMCKVAAHPSSPWHPGRGRWDPLNRQHMAGLDWRFGLLRIWSQATATDKEPFRYLASAHQESVTKYSGNAIMRREKQTLLCPISAESAGLGMPFSVSVSNFWPAD